ncbi:MAG: MFS transporter [Prolixibacteraceae bacterium]|nr:MFS transporter [Prolixibacteraceae bacterium]
MKNSILIKTTLLLCSMFTMMAGAIIAPSLPAMEQLFHQTENVALLTRLVLSIPAIFTAIFAPIFGIGASKMSSKKLLLFSLLLYAFSGVSGLFLDNIYYILIGRIFLGISVAGVMTLSTALIGDYFTGAERNKFIGLQGSFMGFGGVIFVSLAGVMADIKWNLPFAIYLLSLFAFTTGLYAIKEDTHPKEKNEKKDLKQNKTSSNPLKVYILVFIGILMFYILPVQLPFLLSEKLQVTNTEIGITISVMQLTSAVVALFYKKIRHLFEFHTIYILILLFIGLGYIIISNTNGYPLFVLASSIVGIGVGLLMPMGNLWIMEIASNSNRAQLIGNVTTSIYLAQFLSPVLLQPIVRHYGVADLFQYSGYFMVLFALCYTLFQAYQTTLKKEEAIIDMK